MKNIIIIFFIFLSQASKSQIQPATLTNDLRSIGANCSDDLKAKIIADVKQVEILLAAGQNQAVNFLSPIIEGITKTQCPDISQECKVALNFIDFGRSDVLDTLVKLLKRKESRQIAFSKFMDLVFSGSCDANPDRLLTVNRQYDLFLAALSCNDFKEDPIYDPCKSANANYNSLVYASLNSFVLLDSKLQLSSYERFFLWQREALGNRYYIGREGRKFYYNDPWYRYSFYGWLIKADELILVEKYFASNPIHPELLGDMILNIIKPDPYYYGSYGKFYKSTATAPYKWDDVMNSELTVGQIRFLNYLKSAGVSDATRQKCYVIIDNLIWQFISNYGKVWDNEYGTAKTMGYFLAYCDYPHSISKQSFGSKFTEIRDYRRTARNLNDPQLDIIIQKLMQ